MVLQKTCWLATIHPLRMMPDWLRGTAAGSLIHQVVLRTAFQIRTICSTSKPAHAKSVTGSARGQRT